MKTKSINVCLFLAAMTAGTVHAADELNATSSLSKDDVVKHFSHSSSEVSEASVSSDDYEGDADINKRRMIEFNVGPDKKSSKAHSKHSKPNYQKAIKTVSAGKALSLDIQFQYASAELTEEAKAQLRPVGEGLATNELKTISFNIEGYTDAVGSADYNKSLSERRAESVKNYLIETFHVDASRLASIGKGESELLNPNDPDSESNRRVRIVDISR